ncbi:MAG: tyramine oxidase, partial [Pseudomonadota bacterium]|nr:tyramine oxidase [Pseudomonadota bacterium]
MSHPLDQISSEEIEKAVDLYKSHDNSDENTLFINITLVEPSKEIVRNYKDGDGFDRSVKIVGVDSNPDGGFVASVDLNKEEV